MCHTTDTMHSCATAHRGGARIGLRLPVVIILTSVTRCTGDWWAWVGYSIDSAWFVLTYGVPFAGAVVARKTEESCTNCMLWAPLRSECSNPLHRCDFLLNACPCMAVWLALVTQLAVVCQVFGCASDLSGAGGWIFSPSAVSIIHFPCTVCVGMSWLLFCRHTSKISDHTQGTNIVHVEWFTMTS